MLPVPSTFRSIMRASILSMSYAFLRSGTEEYEPDHTKDQYREAGGDKEESKHRWTRLGLPCFGWRFNDVALLLFCHDSLDPLMLPHRLLDAFAACCCGH